MIEKKMEELQKLVTEFKSDNDKRIAELEKKGGSDTLLNEKIEKMNSEISRVEDGIKQAQAAMQRRSSGEDKPVDQKQAEYKAKMNDYLRKGVEFEAKALVVQNDEDGGYLVSAQMSSEIVKKVFESSPLRQLASVQQISGDALEIIEDLDEASIGWVGETQARSETDTPQLKKIRIPLHELYAKPWASQKFLDDSFVNIEAWLAEKVSDKLARAEASAFITGDGFNKPRGILDYANGTGYEQIEQIDSGVNDAIGADGLINLFYALKAPYRANASWLMKRSTVSAVRKLKGTDNNYLWQPGLAGGQPATLLGVPLYEAEDMPAVADGALSVACGDFRAGYQIVDKFGIRVLRDPYSSKPYIEFYTTKRVGGAVKNFEAIKLLAID
jgi:HK97 family phage major capsid protein